MEIKSTVSAEQLLEGIWFRGETNADEKVVQKINELSEIVIYVVGELCELKSNLDNHFEASARDIRKEIGKMEDVLKEILEVVE